MASVDLRMIPRWTQVRSETGLFAIDNAVINLANYPESKSFQNPERARKIAVYWDAGTLTAGDLVELELLVGEPGAVGLDGWIEATRIVDVPPRTVIELLSYGSSILYVRLVSITVNIATADFEAHAAYMPE